MYGPPVPLNAPMFRPGTVAIEKVHPLKYLETEIAADPFWKYHVIEEKSAHTPYKPQELDFVIPEIPSVDSVHVTYKYLTPQGLVTNFTKYTPQNDELLK